jgi:hypothetical protein
MFGIEISWQFMRDLGLIIFVTSLVLVVSRFSRFFLRELGSANVALMATIGDAMMLTGACVAVTAMAIGYLMSVGSP